MKQRHRSRILFTLAVSLTTMLVQSGLVLGQTNEGADSPELIPPLSPARPAQSEELPTPPQTLAPASPSLIEELIRPPEQTNPAPSTDLLQKPLPIRPSQLAVQPLGLDEVRIMAAAGLDLPIIAQVIRNRGVAQPLSVHDLIWLKQNGVSNELIGEIQRVAPRATASSAFTPPATHSYRGSIPPTVVLRTGPRYPAQATPHLYAPRPTHRYHRRIPTRRKGRVSFGISF